MGAGAYVYDYPRPALTVDIAVFVWVEESLRVLMIRRGAEPFAGKWALPGGFVNEGEAFGVAAVRELKEETGLSLKSKPWFVGNYGKLGRDPRGWTVSIAHGAVARLPKRSVKGGDDAVDASWLPVKELAGQLAFDHSTILKDALATLRREVEEGFAGVGLMPDVFGRSQARPMLEAVGAWPAPTTWINRMIKAGLIERSEEDPEVFRQTTARARRTQ